MDGVEQLKYKVVSEAHGPSVWWGCSRTENGPSVSLPRRAAWGPRGTCSVARELAVGAGLCVPFHRGGGRSGLGSGVGGVARCAWLGWRGILEEQN